MRADDIKTLEPGLYVTATPIGNLGDITYRAVETLKNADLILCEDTRQTGKLCQAYGVKTPRSPYHDHNAEQARPGIIKRLQDGARICLVSDAGTPLISDPGYKLVSEARAAEIPVIPCSRRQRSYRRPVRSRGADRQVLLRRIPASQRDRPRQSPASGARHSSNANFL